MIDANNLDKYYNGNILTINSILSSLIEEGYTPIPVVYINESDEILSSLVFDDFICIRISFEDQNDYDINNEINRIVQSLNCNLSNVILLLDMNYLTTDNILMGQMSSIAFVNSVQRINEFEDFFFAATSFPINLSGCKTNSVTEIERIECKIHNYFNNVSSINRIPKFSDYGISNPEIEEMDPRLMTISASVRYTGKSYWYIFKGASVKKYTTDQYYSLCADIVASNMYSGENYSWGDKQIFDKANRIGGPGNPTIWRQIGTSHHITLVVDELSR